MNAGYYSQDVNLQKFNFQDELNIQLVDLEIRCANGSISAHKIILASRSSYFRNLIRAQPNLRIATFADVSREMMRKALELMYGEVVRIPEVNIEEFLRICQVLRLNHWVKFDNIRPLELIGDISPMQSSDSGTTPTEGNFDFEKSAREVSRDWLVFFRQPIKDPNAMAHYLNLSTNFWLFRGNKQTVRRRGIHSLI